jgi:hypothetical protein
MSLPRGDGASAPPTTPEEGASTARHGEADDEVQADPMTVSGQFSCPPTGSYVAISGQSPVAAVTQPGAAENDQRKQLRRLLLPLET